MQRTHFSFICIKRCTEISNWQRSTSKVVTLNVRSHEVQNINISSSKSRPNKITDHSNDKDRNDLGEVSVTVLGIK